MFLNLSDVNGVGQRKLAVPEDGLDLGWRQEKEG